MYPLDYFPLVKELSDSVDPYLMQGLIRQESAFNPDARSPVGARGLMQIEPSTARNMESVRPNQLFLPKTNIRLGIRYFKMLLKRYPEEPELALAAYNAGPGKISYWKQRFSTDNRLLFLDLLPLRETRDYVTSIGRNYFWYKTLYAPTETEVKRNGPFSLG